jgi:PAS domain S-box-containing protein
MKQIKQMRQKQPPPTNITPTISQEERDNIEAFFLSIGEGAITMDENGIVTRANNVALDILGYTQEELVGSWFPEKIIAVHNDGSIIDRLDRPITQAYVTGKTVNERTNYITKNRVAVPVAVTVSPIMRSGKPIGAVEIFRDISLELKADRLKTDFISLASHQLRTPLTAIKLYSQMLEGGMAGKINTEQQEYLKVIISATKTMNQLIKSLLNITRIEAGSIEVVSREVDIVALIEELCIQFSPEAEQKHIKITHKVRPGVPMLNTDPLLVKEVCSNLLSNAIKYSPEGGKISITAKLDDANVVIAVHDTGYGIPEREQERVFSKFFRAENIANKDVTGTGIGLYLVSMVVKSLDGELWFDSTENKGSSFYLSLPRSGTLEKSGHFKLQSD